MFDNQLEKLEEKLDDLRFDKETYQMQIETGFNVQRKLNIINNLIQELERQIACHRGENAGTASEINIVEDIKIACCRGENAGTASEESSLMNKNKIDVSTSDDMQASMGEMKARYEETDTSSEIISKENQVPIDENKVILERMNPVEGKEVSEEKITER